jgi:hypothetical protein
MLVISLLFTAALLIPVLVDLSYVSAREVLRDQPVSFLAQGAHPLFEHGHAALPDDLPMVPTSTLRQPPV